MNHDVNVVIARKIIKKMFAIFFSLD